MVLQTKSWRHSQEYQRAVAIIIPTKGNKVAGQFKFKQTPNGVQVNALLTGLTQIKNMVFIFISLVI